MTGKPNKYSREDYRPMELIMFIERVTFKTGYGNTFYYCVVDGRVKKVFDDAEFSDAMARANEWIEDYIDRLTICGYVAKVKYK